MKDGHGGVVLGSEMSAGVRNVFIENCKMDSPDLRQALRFAPVHAQAGPAQHLQLQPSGADDNVRRNLPPGFQSHALRGEGLDVSVTTSALPWAMVLNRSPLGGRQSRWSHGL